MKCSIFSGERGSQVQYIIKSVRLRLYGAILFTWSVQSEPSEMGLYSKSVVAYRRLKTMEKFKKSAQKVAAYKRWTPQRGSSYNNFKNCLGILEKWSLTRGGHLREVVAQGGPTVFRALESLRLSVAFPG